MPLDEDDRSQAQNGQEVLLHTVGVRPVGQFARIILEAEHLYVFRVDWTSILTGDPVNVTK